MHRLRRYVWFWFALFAVAICCIFVAKIEASPTAVINGSPPPLTKSNSATMTVTGEDIVAYKYRLDGGLYTAEIPNNIQIILSYLGDGFHTLNIVGKDSLGDWQVTATTATWVVDTVAPNTSIDSPRPANPSTEKSGRFLFAATESGSTFECALDRAAYAVCTSPYTFSALSDGIHTFTVRATDGATNPDQSPASYTWTIDTMVPDTTIIAKPPNPTKERTGNFSFNSNETASFECSMDDTAFTVCTTPFDITAIPDGNHTFLVRAKDLAGNIDPSAASYSWLIDTTLPVLSISTLSNGDATSNEILNISGSTDKDGVNLTINGESVPVNTDKTFSHALALQSGANLITTIATDPAGNQTTDTRTITLDQNAPVLAIISPSDNIVTAKPFIEVTGTINETSDVEISVENSSGTNLAKIIPSITGEFKTTVNLAAGGNTIRISATDLLGNKSPTNLKISVVFDDLNPSIAIIEPGNDIKTSQSSMIIRGTVSDLYSRAFVTITKEAETFTPSVINGEFAQKIIFAEDKIYRIAAKATDEAGNVTSTQRNIIYSSSPSRGDINNDGVVDIVDAMRALRISTGLVMLTDEDLIYGDIAPLISGIPSPDGIIDVGDAAIIMKIVIGLVSIQ